MKKGVFSMVFLMMLVSAVSFASADMIISAPNSVYNIGDEFSFNVTINSSSSINNFFAAKIVCLNSNSANSSDEVEIYKIPLSLKSGSQKDVVVSGRFDNFLTGDMGGKCHLNAVYGLDSADTPNFDITRNIYVSLLIEQAIFEPNDRFNVSGRAIKSNGQAMDGGLVEIGIPALGISTSDTVSTGGFSGILSIPDNAPAGNYDVNTKVYEKDDDGKTTNQGEGNTTIMVKQVIRKSEISISAQTIRPDSDFIYTALLYDQSGESIADSVGLSIYQPDGKLYMNGLVSTGEANDMTIGGNFMPGNWRIESMTGSFDVNRSFYVEEYENVSFEVTNGTLTVVNIGNVPYKKSVEVLIGNISKIEDVYVGVGETRRYVLSAPDGEYPVAVDDGQGSQALGRSFLTGSAISVDAEGSGGFFGSSSLLIWIMLISIGALIAIQQYGRISNKAYYGETPVSAQGSSSTPIKMSMSEISGEKNEISDGVREECSVISLKLKNGEEIEKAKGDALGALERALMRARDARAKVYSDRNYKTIVLAPSLTNEKDNSSKAVALAAEIENVLSEHNRRSGGDKIMFGLGVHNGEMIIESLGKGELKFNAIGNTIPYAKKIADTVSYGTGVSEMVHRRVLGKVKSDRVEGTNYWRIRRVMDHQRHSEFISKFVDRQKREGMFKK